MTGTGRTGEVDGRALPRGHRRAGQPAPEHLSGEPLVGGRGSPTRSGVRPDVELADRARPHGAVVPVSKASTRPNPRKRRSAGSQAPSW